MKRNKFKIIFNILFFLLFICVLVYNKDISTYIVNNYIYNKNATLDITKNEYSLNRDYEFVQITGDFVAKDYQHLLNIIYTIIDSGNEEFYFYCDDNYKNCQTDIDSLIPEEKGTNFYDVLSDINNLVHPYNSYKKLTVVMNNYGKIVVKINKQYQPEEIEYINKTLEAIKKKYITDNMTNTQKIKRIHDYIIKTTKYDKNRANNMNNPKYKNSNTHTAYGLLKNNVSLCGGYSDLMSIYIAQLKIPNIRISAEKHVWNLVYINNEWLHLDATWDDPVTNTGAQILIHDYFLINTQKLLRYDSKEHNFNKNFYLEAK